MCEEKLGSNIKNQYLDRGKNPQLKTKKVGRSVEHFVLLIQKLLDNGQMIACSTSQEPN